MIVKLQKNFGSILKFTAITVLAVYASLTSKIEKVNSLTAFGADIIQNVVEFESVEEKNKNLAYGEKNVIQTGMKGLTVEYNGISIEIQKPRTEIIEYGEKVVSTFVGSMTGYGPDCRGCSGRVGAGQDVRGGNIYYEDETYGKLRIVAADVKYPYGTVLKIHNSRALDGPTLAVVMDRGGAITGDKLDLLYETEAEVPGIVTQNNITIDVIRIGW